MQIQENSGMPINIRTIFAFALLALIVAPIVISAQTKRDSTSPIQRITDFRRQYSIDSSFHNMLETGKALFKESEDELIQYRDSAHKVELLLQALDTLKQAVVRNPRSQEAHYYYGYTLERYLFTTDSSFQLPNISRDRVQEVSKSFERVVRLAPEYNGELWVLDPRSKLTSLWGSLAFSYIYKGKLDSARLAFEHGKKYGGFPDVLLEYCRNIMSSCDSNSVLLVSGNNDTYPMWYVQQMEGFRKDIHVVNLHLCNTLWYLSYLKRPSPFGAPQLPISFSDDMLDQTRPRDERLSYSFGPPIPVSMDVPKNILIKYTSDTELLYNSKMAFQFHGSPYDTEGQDTTYLFRLQDKFLLDLLKNMKFRRYIYLSTTISRDSYCGLEKYFRYEGLAIRICPAPQKTVFYESVHPYTMERCLMDIKESGPYTDGIYEFRIGNLFTDEEQLASLRDWILLNYRWAYVLYSSYMIKEMKDSVSAVNILNKMNDMMPFEKYEMGYEFEYRIASLYEEAGAMDKVREYADLGLRTCTDMIADKEDFEDIINYEIAGWYLGPYRMAAHLHGMKSEYGDAIEWLEKLIRLSMMYKEQIQADPLYTKDDFDRLDYNLADLNANIDKYKVLEMIAKGKGREAYDVARVYYDRYRQSEEPGMLYIGTKYLKPIINQLEQLYKPKPKQRRARGRRG